MKLRDFWDFILAPEIVLVVDNEIFYMGDIIEAEKKATAAGLWLLEVEGVSVYANRLRLRVYHGE